MAKKRAANGCGTIRLRTDGRYEAILTVGHDPGTGKPIRKSVYDKNKTECEKKRRALAAEIDKQAKKHGIVMDVLVEINSGREENKSGVMPEDVKTFCLELQKFDSINLRGFMTMAPKCENKAKYFKYFEETCKLVLDIWTILSHNNSKMILSMGMSDSYEEAILSGATHVRIGRSIFKK